MKVLSFLEFYNLTPKEKRDYLSKLGLISINDYKTRCDYGDEVAELTFLSLYHNEVSVPFKPELITEKFEGWEKSKNELVFYKDFVETETIEFNEYGEMVIKQLFTNKFIYPRTLDDFINDTTRAGIELTWKVAKCE